LVKRKLVLRTVISFHGMNSGGCPGRKGIDIERQKPRGFTPNVRQLL
jgi:hypothetical protein